MMMEGTLTIDSVSLRNAMRWAGQAPPGSGGFGRFALKARANVVGPSIALTNVNVELDSNAAEGVMTYANNGRQTLQASSTSLRISPPFACSPAARATGTGSCSISTRCRQPISTCACRRRG
jgi:hypothetical protein